MKMSLSRSVFHLHPIVVVFVFWRSLPPPSITVFKVTVSIHPYLRGEKKSFFLRDRIRKNLKKQIEKIV